MASIFADERLAASLIAISLQVRSIFPNMDKSIYIIGSLQRVNEIVNSGMLCKI